MSSGKILCVDLGTSSIRAAVRDGDANARALLLGETFRSSIDGASIPSAIFVAADLSKAYFGEQALARGLRGERAYLFNTSPKAWMTTVPPEELRREILPGTHVTPRHLLAGLLAQAFSAASKDFPKSEANVAWSEIRVAHPVWDAAQAEVLRDDLAWITSGAIRLASMTDTPVALEKLVSRLAGLDWSEQRAALDVVEPVAAALQLFENSENAREFCAVIDIGAGSTDMAIFLSLTPDAPGYRWKFVPCAAPKSVHVAGDFIDREVINLIRNKSKRASKEELYLVELRRRRIKETLFSAGRVFEAGCEITVDELEAQAGIREMQRRISEAFRQLVEESAKFMSTFIGARDHRAETLNVIFAGGGSSIGFLHRAVGKYVKVDAHHIPIVIRRAPSAPRGLPASLERMAVALGGSVPARDWPVTSLQPGEWTTRVRNSV